MAWQDNASGGVPAAVRGALVLYTRRGCHLCAEAEAMLAPLLQRSHRTLLVVDVDADPAMAARYGMRVPVLACDGRELCFGRFDRRVLQALFPAPGFWSRVRRTRSHDSP